MRKLILITAFVLAASVSVEAGETRGLVLASDEQPTTSIETAGTAEARTAATIPGATQSVAQPAAAETKAEAPKRHDSKSSKKTHARTWRDDEAKARRIAAKYGVYW